MKKLWNKNRVLFMLIVILIVCFIAIVCVALTFFYSKNTSPYGSRLDNVKKHQMAAKDKDKIKDTILESKSVKKVTLTEKVRTLYLKIKFDNDISLDDAKKVAESSLELFGKKVLEYYDIEFTLESDNFVIFGAKNSVIDHVSWNNNKKIETEEEEETDEE